MLESLTDHSTFVARVTTQTEERHVLRPVLKHHREDGLGGPGHGGHVELVPGNCVFHCLSSRIFKLSSPSDFFWRLDRYGFMTFLQMMNVDGDCRVD